MLNNIRKLLLVVVIGGILSIGIPQTNAKAQGADDETLIRQLNSGMTKAQLIALNHSNYQQTVDWQRANSQAKPLPQRSMSGNTYYRANAVSWANANAYDTDGNINYQNLDHVFGLTGGDCTNFVSQALWAGNIGETANNSSPGWWYDQGSNPPNYA